MKSSVPTPLAAVYRGSVSESCHYGEIVVADTQGKVLWRTPGLSEAPVYFRSAMKPIQALPFILTGTVDAYALGDKEIAVACASHSGEPAHVETVERILGAAGKVAKRASVSEGRLPALKYVSGPGSCLPVAKRASVSERRREPGGGRIPDSCLKCGTHVPYSPDVAAKLARQGKEPPVLCHNCSGKHAAMLLTCRHQGWPLESYLEPTHPLQVWIKELVAAFADLEVADVVSGKDGCNLPAHAVSLRRMAMTYARLAGGGDWGRAKDRGALGAMRSTQSALGATRSTLAGVRVTGAMRREPFLVAGTGRTDTVLMEAARGAVFSKIGAEAVWCMGFPGKGIGLAMKIADGANRAQAAIAAEALRQTGLLPIPAIRRFIAAADKPITSSDGTVVGRYETLFRLARG